MDTKEYLGQYQKAQQELAALLIHRDNIITKGSNVNSMITGIPNGKGTVSRRVEDAGTKLADLDDIREKVDKCKKIHRKVTETIYSVDDAELRAVLIHRYLSGMSWEEICATMNYSWRQIHRMHPKALEQVKKTWHTMA